MGRRRNSPIGDENHDVARTLFFGKSVAASLDFIRHALASIELMLVIILPSPARRGEGLHEHAVMHALRPGELAVDAQSEIQVRSSGRRG